MSRYLNFHTASPFLYILFVKCITQLNPCPKSKIMRTCRKYHNINLSILSGLMLGGIVTGNIRSDKMSSVYDIVCKPYDGNWFVMASTNVFLYSKYLEWGDTLFLHLSGRPISTLQYTHHMTTGWLMYMNMVDYPSPHLIVYIGLNCFVHVPMYWYFAYPKGILLPFRQLITQSQIIQHVICLCTALYVYHHDCDSNEYGHHCGFAMYSMYLFYFGLFYVNSYMKKKR